MTKAANKKDIAIVGMSCKFPQSNDLKGFWENLFAGNELVHFYSDEELVKLGLTKQLIENPDFIRAKSMLDDPERFDFSFFGYTKDEAAVMDPQIRIMHELVWTGLEDAGCDILSNKNKIGVYLSASDNQDWIAHTRFKPNEKVNAFLASQLNNKNFISTLISYSLNLKGPSYYLHTACSSSLAAVHIACRNLLLKECSMAVAGGIRIDSSVARGYFYEEGMVSSKDGHTRAFDANSSGTIAGQGGAVVILKRMEDALRDRDHIYAVIKASATNNDGKSKVGYTAPSVNGQVACMRMAQRIANVAPEEITYIETHGTGTKLGDTIEIEALNKVFNHNKAHQCAIGSVKSNLGHPDTAAGIAGLVKTSLGIKHKTLLPSLNFTEANPEIDFASGPFYVNTTTKKWETKNGSPLYAGISSLGIGGTNVHLILGESPVLEKGKSKRPFQLFPFSAKTKTSLQKYQEKLSPFFAETTNAALANIAYTLQVGRVPFRYRSFVVGNSKEQLSEKLQEDLLVYQSETNKPVVFMFPGQGSQYFQMARDIYREEAFFKNIMDAGFAILQKETGEDYAVIIGYTGAMEDQDTINHTLYTQPLIFLIEYALAALLMHWGISAKHMIGHSLGEYTAACLSGVFSFEAALKIIVKRAQLMGKVKEGDMLGVGMPAEEIAPLLNPALSIATVNTEKSCVISGTKQHIAALQTVLKAQEIPSRILKTSHAFHSEMMEEILEEFSAVLQEIDFAEPQHSFISNVSGKEIEPQEAMSPAYWVSHLRNTVKFSAGIKYLMKQGNAVYIEIGPGKTLSTFCKQQEGFMEKNSTVSLIRHPNSQLDDNEFLTNGLGKIWSMGVAIDWTQYYGDELRHKVSVPTYCFDDYAFEVEVDPFGELMKNGAMSDAFRRPLDQWFYIPNWKKALLPNPPVEEEKLKNYLLFEEESSLLAAVETELKKLGHQVLLVKRGAAFQQKEDGTFVINPNQEKELEKLFQAIAATGIVYENFVVNWQLDNHSTDPLLNAFNRLKHLAKHLLKYREGEKKKITYLSDFNHPVLGNESIRPVSAAAKSLLTICAQENPELFACSIDVDASAMDAEEAEAIVRELENNTEEIEVAYRYGKRWTNAYSPVALNDTEKEQYLKPGKTYLFTGAIGNIGEVLLKYLHDAYGAKIVVLGKGAQPPQELQQLAAAGYPTEYYQADFSDLERVREVKTRMEKDHGKIAGIIHATANINHGVFKPVDLIDPDSTQKQFHYKAKGIQSLYEVFKAESLDFVWIKSSLSSILGGLTYATFAVSNKFIDSFISQHQKELKNWFCINLDGYGNGGINESEMIAVFEKSFSIGTQGQLVVSIRDLKKANINQAKSKIAAEEEVRSEDIINRPQISVAYQAPDREIEKELCLLWEAFFGYEKVGIHDDFFELGGDSLKVMTMLKRIQKKYKMEINLLDFYGKPTIKSLADEIEMAFRLIQIQQVGTKKNRVKI